MSDQNPQPTVNRRRWRPWQILCLVILLLIVGFYCYYSIRQAQTEARLKGLIAEIEKIDPHWRRSDLKAEYQKRPISPAILKCFASMPPGYRGWSWDDILTRPGAIDYWPNGRHYHLRMPEPYYQILKDRLTDAKVQPMRQALRELLHESAGYRLHETASNNYPYQYTEDFKKIACLIQDESLLAAHQGDGDQVVMAFQMAMNNARLLEHGPDAMDRPLALGRRIMAVDSVNQALTICQLTEPQLQRLQSILDKQTTFNLHQTLRCYRASYFDYFEGARTDSELRSELIRFCTDPLDGTGTWNKRAQYWIDRVNAEFIVGNISARQVELHEFTAQALTFNTNQPRQLLNYLKGQKAEAHNALLKNSLTNCEKIVTAHYIDQALALSLQAALGCERYRLAHGKWPTTLDAIVPQYLSAVPLDPFSGQPLLYRLLPDGVAIYSVGANGVDDQGDVLETTGAPKDRGTRLFNPEHRGKKFEQSK